LLQNSIEIINKYKPDLIIFAGDREDTIMAAMIGSFLHIPTAHFYGGDHVMDGNVDNPVRHAVSKLSSFHFVSTQVHYDRLVSIGENIERIYNIGSMALDNFKNHKPMSTKSIINHFKLNKNFTDFCLLIFHPLDLESDSSSQIFQNILKVLNDLNIKVFASYPNTDPGNQKIISVIKKYYNNENFKFFKNLPRDVFLSIYKNSKFLIGNSSSGIIEAASIPLPVVNVGKRQKNRDQSGNVLFCKTKYEDIYDAVNEVSNQKFQKRITNIKNIYGDGMSVEKAFLILKQINFSLFTHKTEDPLKVVK
jgi:UDP-hydrolysing UDP-N-acetyl-D-glucosamine 2-epimerase